MMKTLGMLLSALLVVVGMTIGAGPEAMAGTTIAMKAGTVIDPSHPYNLGIVKFGEIIGQKTNGRLKVELYHSSQLGNERDLVEGLGMGSVDLAAVSSAPVSSFVPKIAVFDLPYLFASREQAYKVMDGPVGQGFFKDLEAKNVIGLAYFENGFRNITNSKRPINVPADMKGIKIRVMESPVPIATFNTIGANATPMAWGEVFTALQQKTIDAQENPMPVIYTQKLFEVQKYLTLSEHFYAPALFLMSKALYSKLTADEQKIVRDAAREAALYERKVSKQQAEDFVAKCKEKGMMVNEVNKKVWQDAMAPVYAKFEAQLGKELIEAVRNPK